MSKVTIMCDRCKKTVEGLHIMGSGTAGFYQVSSGTWAQFANPDELVICDACMWRDPRYIADYGQRTIGGPSTEELKRDLEAAIGRADKTQKDFLSCMAEFEDTDITACGEHAQDAENAEVALIELWRKHRDKVGFVVWNHPETRIPEPVITAWPTEEKS